MPWLLSDAACGLTTACGMLSRGLAASSSPRHRLFPYRLLCCFRFEDVPFSWTSHKLQFSTRILTLINRTLLPFFLQPSIQFRPLLISCSAGCASCWYPPGSPACLHACTPHHLAHRGLGNRKPRQGPSSPPRHSVRRVHRNSLGGQACLEQRMPSLTLVPFHVRVAAGACPTALPSSLAGPQRTGRTDTVILQRGCCSEGLSDTPRGRMRLKPCKPFVSAVAC